MYLIKYFFVNLVVIVTYLLAYYFLVTREYLFQDISIPFSIMSSNIFLKYEIK